MRGTDRVHGASSSAVLGVIIGKLRKTAHKIIKGSRNILNMIISDFSLVIPPNNTTSLCFYYDNAVKVASNVARNRNHARWQGSVDTLKSRIQLKVVSAVIKPQKLPNVEIPPAAAGWNGQKFCRLRKWLRQKRTVTRWQIGTQKCLNKLDSFGELFHKGN